MRNRSFPLISFLFLLLCIGVSTSNAAETLADMKSAKIVLLSVATYKNVVSGEAVGAALSLNEEVKGPEAEQPKKKEDVEIDFTLLNKAGLDAHAKALTDKFGWQIIPAADAGNPAALEQFKLDIDAARQSLSEGGGNNSARWERAPGLPFVPVMPVIALVKGDYPKKLEEAVKKFCEAAGVDGALILEFYPGYATTGASALFSAVTAGSGKGVAKISPAYALFNKDGTVAAKPVQIKSYESEDSFWMAGGVAKLDKEMEKLLIQAMSASAEGVTDRVDDDLD